MLNKAPWELYAKAMFNLSGFPLWHADPEIDENFGRREVELGSVGFLDRGKFRHLFNARKGEDDPFNAGRVPSTFEQFNPPNLSITAPKPILRQSYITSGSVRELTVSLEGGAESPVAILVSAGGSVSFKCKQNAGALLVLDQPGIGQSIPTKRYIVTYLRAHMDSWFEWANEGLSYDVRRREDIKFVFGTIKTTRWACAAFSGSYRDKKGVLKVTAAPFGDIDINVSIESKDVPPEFRNKGPVATTAEDVLARASTPLPCDQCIFFHYYALKKRPLLRWKYKLIASAGPHELPPEDPDMEGNSPIIAAAKYASECDIEEHPSSDTTEGGEYDPVAVLLDYILAKTDAGYAVASDTDVLAIFGPAGVPDDIMAGLEAINPTIEVDDLNDVATVTVDTTWLDQQRSGQSVTRGTEESRGHASGPEHVEDIPYASSGALGGPQKEQPVVGTGDQAALAQDVATGGVDGHEHVEDITAALGGIQAQRPPANGHTGSKPITSLPCLPDERHAASGSEDMTLAVRNVSEERGTHKLTRHPDAVSSDSLQAGSIFHLQHRTSRSAEH